MAPKAGFRLPERTALLCFDASNGDYAGAEVKCNLSVPLDIVFQIQEKFQDESDVKQAFQLFTSQILLGWNLEGPDGAALPLQGIDGVMPVPVDFAALIVTQWLEAVQNPPSPLSSSSANGSTSEETPSPQTEQS